MSDLRILPLEARHTALGARFGEFAGWRMPLWYGGALEEHIAVRKAAGVFDISHMGRFRVDGPNAASILAASFSRDPSRLAPGESIYALCCNESGGIIDDLLVYRLSPVLTPDPSPQAERGLEPVLSLSKEGEVSRFLVICNAANADRVGQALKVASARFPNSGDPTHAPGFNRGYSPDAVVLESASDPPSPLAERGLGGEVSDVLLAVQGPSAVERVAHLLGRQLLDVKRHACIEFSRDGHDYFAGRGGYTGEDGFEVMTDAEAGADLLQRLIEDEDTLPCGLAARDSLRLEAALPLHGHDIDETTSPWAAGLGWAIELDHDFPGRDAIEASKAAGTRRLACLVSDGQGIFRSDQDVYDGNKVVASLTSGGFSPMLNTSIAMAYLPRALAREGTSLEIDLRGRRVVCHVVKRPFYSSPDLASKR